MKVTLSISLAILGAASCLIALSMIFVGPSATGALGEASFDFLLNSGLPSAPLTASADSELRFYAALFFMFGVLCLRAARNIDHHSSIVPWLAAAFFAGGFGRALSWVMMGPPHPFYLLLMAIELIVPPVLMVLWLPLAADRRG
jgi:hypothetical protein